MIKILVNGRYVLPTETQVEQALDVVLNATIEVEFSKQIELLTTKFKTNG